MHRADLSSEATAPRACWCAGTLLGPALPAAPPGDSCLDPPGETCAGHPASLRGTASTPHPAPLAFVSAPGTARRGSCVPWHCRAVPLPPADTRRLAPGKSQGHAHVLSQSSEPFPVGQTLWKAPERCGVESLSRRSPASGTSPGYPACPGRLGSNGSKKPADFLRHKTINSRL